MYHALAYYHDHPREMRDFLLDENIDPKTATYLEKEGIHAEHVRDAIWQGADERCGEKVIR